LLLVCSDVFFIYVQCLVAIAGFIADKNIPIKDYSGNATWRLPWCAFCIHDSFMLGHIRSSRTSAVHIVRQRTRYFFAYLVNAFRRTPHPNRAQDSISSEELLQSSCSKNKISSS
jgi:hypothetical protein